MGSFLPLKPTWLRLIPYLEKQTSLLRLHVPSIAYPQLRIHVINVIY